MAPHSLRTECGDSHAEGFQCFDDGVVASTGTSNFWIVASDSPSLPRKLEAAFLILSAHPVLSPLPPAPGPAHPRAATDGVQSNHVLPAKVRNGPERNALLPVRMHSSRATSRVTRSLDGRPISSIVSSTLRSDSTFKKELLQLNGQRLLQRVVKDGIAGLVVEVSHTTVSFSVSGVSLRRPKARTASASREPPQR